MASKYIKYWRLPAVDRFHGETCPDRASPGKALATLRDSGLEEAGEKCQPSCTTNPIFFCTLALFTLAGIVLLILSQTRKSIGDAQDGPQRLRNLLELPTEIVTFEPDALFAAFPGAESDTAWYGLLGPSDGFISLKNPEQYGLPRAGLPNKKDPESQIFGITMFHQLHCLITIREVYYGLLLGGANQLKYLVEHVQHCFDFLRQGIRCSGAMDIEMPHKDSEIRSRSIKTAGGTVDGYGSPHVCRRWSSAVEVMDKLKFDKPPHEHYQTFIKRLYQ